LPQVKRPTQASKLNIESTAYLGKTATRRSRTTGNPCGFFPGIKALMAQAQDAPRDWQSAIFPLLAVIAFVILLIFLV
jgi:hypothetical protein